MKGNMMILAPLWLLLCWMSPEGSMAVDPPIPLTMEEDSVDDMYFGCREEMWKLVQEQYFEKEKKDISWDNENIKKCSDKSDNTGLTEHHKRAICIYTSPMFREFNPAVRTGGKNYGSSFKFHSLHFLLTSAIQILQRNNNKHCQTVYRRTKVDFTGNIDKIIRFGNFASTSLKKTLNFGSETCFVIETCLGAYVNDYSLFPEQEEVLIPPYEMFKITKIYVDKKFPDTDLKDCKKVFVLESVGVKSNLNCKLVHPKTKLVDELFGRR